MIGRKPPSAARKPRSLIAIPAAHGSPDSPLLDWFPTRPTALETLDCWKAGLAKGSRYWAGFKRPEARGALLWEMLVWDCRVDGRLSQASADQSLDRFGLRESGSAAHFRTSVCQRAPIPRNKHATRFTTRVFFSLQTAVLRRYSRMLKIVCVITRGAYVGAVRTRTATRARRNLKPCGCLRQPIRKEQSRLV